MARPRRVEDGAAIIEFIVLGIGVLIPIAYLVSAASVVGAAAFASTQAAREAARAFASAATVTEARSSATAAARLAFADHDLGLPGDALQVHCVDGPCLSPGSTVDVVIDWAMPLPWLPFGMAPVSIPLTAHQIVPVDDLRSDP
jgi:hypothetical protein